MKWDIIKLKNLICSNDGVQKYIFVLLEIICALLQFVIDKFIKYFICATKDNKKRFLNVTDTDVCSDYT